MDSRWQNHLRDHPTIGPWYARYDRSRRILTGRPGWVARGALIAAALVIVVPLVLLTIAAVTVGVVVFALLSVVARVTGLLAGGVRRSGHDGRRNVRIISGSSRVG